MLTVTQIKNFKNKVVLLRGDLDAPIKKGKVADNFRLRRMLPTIKYLSKKGANIIIIGHLGRPNGRVDENLSIAPIANELRKLLYINKKEIGNWKLEIGCFYGFFISDKICMLENLRFYEEEEKNYLKFAKKLAGLGDVYVNDCFSASHRKHASIVGIPKYLPSFVGLNLEKEVEVLSKAMNNPKRPAVAILGGAKLETKLPLIKKLSDIFDYILVGGKLALELEKKLGNSHCEINQAIFQGKEIKKLPQNIILPVDYLGDDKLDIGQKTIKLYAGMLKKARTIIWNGPMGKYEDKRYIKGTYAISKAAVSGNAHTIIGGGDIIAALGSVKILEKMDFVSTGGGAMLEFLEKGTIVGIEAIEVESAKSIKSKVKK